MFAPGMLVECIVSGPWFALDGSPSPASPTKGRIYTITGVHGSEFLGRDFISLAEIGVEPVQWYAAQYFRPVVEQRIASLRALLVPMPEMEDA